MSRLLIIRERFVTWCSVDSKEALGDLLRHMPLASVRADATVAARHSALQTP